ncbi:MAG TPA: hypothetical protein VFA59_11785 [Vicinamibacterales bacterium]|nr:hypothetical protein [Vicinamibacterales bacterium]
MADDEGRTHLDRLKKLAAELEAAKAASDETVKHVVGAKRQSDRLITHDTRFLDTSKKTAPTRPSRARRRVGNHK